MIKATHSFVRPSSYRGARPKLFMEKTGGYAVWVLRVESPSDEPFEFAGKTITAAITGYNALVDSVVQKKDSAA